MQNYIFWVVLPRVLPGCPGTRMAKMTNLGGGGLGFWVGGWVRGPKGPENFIPTFWLRGKIFGAWEVKMTTPRGAGSGWLGTWVGGPEVPPPSPGSVKKPAYWELYFFIKKMVLQMICNQGFRFFFLPTFGLRWNILAETLSHPLLFFIFWNLFFWGGGLSNTAFPDPADYSQGAGFDYFVQGSSGAQIFKSSATPVDIAIQEISPS